jgi:hypothetical protein
VRLGVAEHLSSSVGARDHASICFVSAFTTRLAFGPPRRSHQRNLHLGQGKRCSVPAAVARTEDSSATYDLESHEGSTGPSPQPPDAIWFAAARRKGYRCHGVQRECGRRPRGSRVASGGASHDDQHERGPGAEASDGGWTGGARGHTRMGRRAGDAGHDVADAWGIGRVWGSPVGARGHGSAGRTTRGANQGAAALPLRAFWSRDSSIPPFAAWKDAGNHERSRAATSI